MSPREECLVGACEKDGAVRMTLNTFGETRQAMFCEEHAKQFDGTWQRVEPEVVDEDQGVLF